LLERKEVCLEIKKERAL
jgi:hypothetical protein